MESPTGTTRARSRPRGLGSGTRLAARVAQGFLCILCVGLLGFGAALTRSPVDAPMAPARPIRSGRPVPNPRTDVLHEAGR